MLKLDFKQKYLKYKYKYLYIKSQIGGSDTYLWYIDEDKHKDSKFSLPIYQQKNITQLYNQYLWLGDDICQDGICIKKDKDDNISIKFVGNRLKFIEFDYVHFNQGIRIYKLPICMEFIENYLYNFFDLSDIDLISVGSGNGLFEKCCEDVFGKEIICIDPDPLSFRAYGLDSPYKEPTYSTVDDYLLSPTKKDKSILFLIWPDPNPSFEYDRKAILKLKPISIFIIYGKFPLAGGEYLRRLLYSHGKYITLKDDSEQVEYEKLATTEVTGKMDLTHMKYPINIRMSVCIQKNISLNILELKKQQDEIEKRYSYCKQALISKLSSDTQPINVSFSVDVINLS